MFKYDLGQTLRIKAGIYEGHTFIVEDEDCVQMSSGKYPLPQYYYTKHGRWYYEDEVEPVRQERETVKKQ